jgi:hypothetical protein
MKKALKKSMGVYHLVDGKKIAGVPASTTGNVSGLRGDVTGMSGDIDDCEITESDREAGVDIQLLFV